jgi:hypothetical protein
MPDMAKLKKASGKRAGRARKDKALREVTKLSEGFFLGRYRDPRSGVFTVKSSESARVLVKKAGRVLSKPGIERSAIFPPGRSADLFAYSVDPKNPKRIVRESSGGKITRGRFVDGRFKAT